ncbi:MAG: hypothetical protein KGH57_04470 [Candidatus Micrarchaeota archaeon]|nr:hypothetical protein [Candidatus Micrarchaeota archaeon]
MTASLSFLLALVAGVGFGIISGSEMAMLTVAASIKYKWRAAWTITFAGLATMLPVGAAIYYFFMVLPEALLDIAAGGVIFIIGAYFLAEGLLKKNEEEEEEERIKAGMLGIYSGFVLEGIEITTVVVSVGIALGSLASGISGLLIGWVIPLATVRFLKSTIEKIEKHSLKIAVGLIMMVVAGSLVLFHLP